MIDGQTKITADNWQECLKWSKSQANKHVMKRFKQDAWQRIMDYNNKKKTAGSKHKEPNL